MSSKSKSEQTEIALTHFRAGVTAILRTWPAMKAAVDGEWGGHETHAKAEDLRFNIYQHFDGSSSEGMPLEELEDNLVMYMEEEFSVVLEDESERQIASLIHQIYQECSKGNVETVKRLVDMSVSMSSSQATSRNRVVVQTDPNAEVDSDEESDDDVDGDGDGDGDDEMMDEQESEVVNTDQSTPVVMPTVPFAPNEFPYDLNFAKSFLEGPLFEGGPQKKPKNDNLPPPRQLGEPEPEKPQVQLDEDGFAPVPSRRGRKKK